jgi:LmbE family N-acetylglucosaminyl deacetylase
MTKLMAITAHPQDLVERTGGTFAKHIERGDEVMWVSLTTGVVTHAFNTFPATGDDKLKDIDKVKEMKRQKLSRACKVLGVQSWKLLDFPENPMLSGFDEYSTVIELIREFRPDVVLCPPPD